MWRFVVVSLVLSFATSARADDPRDVFGLGKKQPAQPQPPTPSQPPATQDVHDAFGLGKKASQPELDCSGGEEMMCVGATDPLAPTAAPYALTTWLPSSYLLKLPVANATHNDVAFYAMGASRDEAGVFFANGNGLDNRWLVEGAPADNVRTGAAGNRIPLAFLDGMWVTAGGFTARDRTSTGGVIDAQLKSATKDHEVDARAWLGWTSEARKRAVAVNTYFVRRGTVDIGPELQLAIVATGPFAALGNLVGGTGWYVGGVAPELSSTKFTWHASTIVDADNDGNPDGLPGIVVTDPINSNTRSPLTWSLPLLGRVGFDRGVHHVDLSLVGTVGTEARYLFNSTLQAAGVNAMTLDGNAIATWRGEWASTHARAQLAWYRQVRRESARDPKGGDIPQVLSAYVPADLPDDPAVAAACLDDVATDKYPMIPNCPVPIGWFYSGGAGPLTNQTGDRPSVTADVAHQIGNNVVRAGATGEDTRLVQETRFTGGMQIRSIFPGHMSQRQFADPATTCSTDVALPCPTVDTSELSYRTRYTAAYLEDTWQATPDVAVDGGLRWELMWVGTVLHFSDELSPRLGASWDPLGGGRSRLWTSMGRSFAYLPAGLGSTIIHGEKTVDHIISQFGEGRSVLTGAPVRVVPGIEPITQDELTGGADVALAGAFRARAWLQGRWLRRGIETTENGFDNPGREGGLQAVKQTGLFAIELSNAPTSQLVLRVGYLYSRTFGTWSGAFDPRQGAILYAGSDFDIQDANARGRLPDDMGHRTYIEAQRSGQVGSVKLSIATRLTVGSGRPRNALGDSDDGIIFLVPRGSAGRGPLLTQANIRIGALWRGFDITLDLFNVFNQRDSVSIDEVYAGGAIRPIDQGTLSDLVFLKTADGSPASRNPSYATATSFEPPLSAVLGVQRGF